jgi:hypothetical protein
MVSSHPARHTECEQPSVVQPTSVHATGLKLHRKLRHLNNSNTFELILSSDTKIWPDNRKAKIVPEFK